MFETALFLGIPINEDLKASLDKLNPHMRELFIKNGSEYLHYIEREELSYLGKQLANIQELSKFDLLEANVKSLVQKLAPDYPIQEQELLLFPYSC